MFDLNSGSANLVGPKAFLTVLAGGDLDVSFEMSIKMTLIVKSNLTSDLIDGLVGQKQFFCLIDSELAGRSSSPERRSSSMGS